MFLLSVANKVVKQENPPSHPLLTRSSQLQTNVEHQLVNNSKEESGDKDVSDSDDDVFNYLN